MKVKIEEEEFGMKKGEENHLVQREHEVIQVKQVLREQQLNPERDEVRGKMM